jgi:hypothetical protein
MATNDAEDIRRDRLFYNRKSKKLDPPTEEQLEQAHLIA